MQDKEILKIENLHFSYTPKEEILKGLNFSIDDRSTAIIGQNGAGKTTFVKLLKGLLKPDSGSIKLYGKDIKDMTVAQIAKEIGMVFQNPNDQIFKNKVIDEVMFGPLKIGMNEKQAKLESLKALEELGLKDLAQKNPYDLGLSTRKLVAIASIIAMDTKVVIFDEPTIAQDYHGKQLIKKLIKRLKNDKKTVITIIHDMDFVAESFDRAIVFAKGEAILDSDTKTVFSKREILKKSYLEQPSVTKLCNLLGYEDIFLTVEEFIDYQKHQN